MKVTYSILGILLTFSAGVFAAPRYPVDDDIQRLLDKAQHLTMLKETLADFDCSVTIDKNTVKLVPGALRSEGLVIGVGENFPGNYLAYHKAPKPQFLENVVAMTLGPKAAKNALVLTLRTGTQTPTAGPAVTVLQIVANEPYEVKNNPGLWIYEQRGVTIPLPATGTVATNTGKSAFGKSLTFTCQ